MVTFPEAMLNYLFNNKLNCNVTLLIRDVHIYRQIIHYVYRFIVLFVIIYMFFCCSPYILLSHLLDEVFKLTSNSRIKIVVKKQHYLNDKPNIKPLDV